MKDMALGFQFVITRSIHKTKQNQIITVRVNQIKKTVK